MPYLRAARHRVHARRRQRVGRREPGQARGVREAWRGSVGQRLSARIPHHARFAAADTRTRAARLTRFAAADTHPGAWCVGRAVDGGAAAARGVGAAGARRGPLLAPLVRPPQLLMYGPKKL